MLLASKKKLKGKYVSLWIKGEKNNVLFINKRSLYMPLFSLQAKCVHEKNTCCVCETGPWTDNDLDR